MIVGYWIVAAALALLYLYAGGVKLVRSREQLAPLMQWVQSTPMWLVRFIGVVELAGVAGLVLPPATGVVPPLAVVAAIGLLVLQLLAAGVHLRRGEGVGGIPINAVLIVLAAAAAWLATAW